MIRQSEAQLERYTQQCHQQEYVEPHKTYFQVLFSEKASKIDLIQRRFSPADQRIIESNSTMVHSSDQLGARM